MIKWPTHCKKCEYYVSQMCDYCNQTGKSRLKEFGVDKSLELDDRITDLNNRCTHWQDERNQKEYYAQKKYEAITAKREEKKRIEAEKKQREEEQRLKEMDMYNRRYALYCKGLSDAEIGRHEGCDKSTIWDWRKRNNLPCNNGKVASHKVPVEIQAKRLRLYNQGFSDKEIAEQCGLEEYSITRWRWTNHYPNKNRVNGICDREKLVELHRKGFTDSEIAKELKCKDSTVQDARCKLGLKPNSSKRPASYRDKFIELYDKGMNDRQIADELGKTREAIRKARCKMGLPRHD